MVAIAADNVPGTTAPATGARLDPVTHHSPDDVRAAVARARVAQPAWSALGLRQREVLMRRLARAILERRDEGLVPMILETGRNPTECLIAELAGTVDYVEQAIRAGRKALATDKVKLSPLDWPGKKVTIEAVPRGVVGIIAPWNYPVANFFKHLFPALLSGNTVVMKPSEHTPRSGAWLASVCAAVLPKDVVVLVQGAGAVGEALVDNVDAVTFTGSVKSGRRVSARAGERLIPSSVELGGKDAALILADCDLERTALGITQWAMHNAGQNCAAIERVYVEESIADNFVERLGNIAKKLRAPGTSADGVVDVGPLQNAAQLRIVEAHVDEAKSKGAKVLAGGKATGTGFGYEPTVLDRCTVDMRVVREETFGPVIAVLRVRDAEEGLRLANESSYGLNGSVWTKDLKKGAELARRLEVGVAYVNNHAVGGALAEIPWTGTRETGPGVAASRYAYSVFVRRRTLMVDSNKNPDPIWYPFDATFTRLVDALVARSLGKKSGMFTLLGVLGKRLKAIKSLAA